MHFLITKFKIFENNFWKISRELLLSSSKNVRKIKQLIDLGADVNIEYDSYGWTPLLWATYYRQISIMKLLIDNGADINHKGLHHISGTKKMVDFYDLAKDKLKYDNDENYRRVVKWIEENYPEFVMAKRYNL